MKLTMTIIILSAISMAFGQNLQVTLLGTLYKQTNEIYVDVSILSDALVPYGQYEVENEIRDYTKLRVKNLFHPVPLAPDVSPVVVLRRLLRLNEAPYSDSDSAATISFSIFTVGTDYPIAYRIEFVFREPTVGSRCWSFRDGTLGVANKKDLLSVVKRGINTHLESFAIMFFKRRGEL